MPNWLNQFAVLPFLPKPADTIKTVIELRGISKSYGKNRVLNDVNLVWNKGQVHVIAGENGAGKSTLVRIVGGAIDDYDGNVFVAGQAVQFSGPRDASRAGIVSIHQELSLLPALSVADNLALGRHQSFWHSKRSSLENARLWLGRMELDLDPRASVASLPLSTKQLLEIARALSRQASVVIMDEPTSALTTHEVETLFERMEELRRRGVTILYISHRLDEVYRLADTISVLKDGRLVHHSEASKLERRTLVRLMVSDSKSRSAPSTPSSLEPRQKFRVEALNVEGHSGSRKVVDNFSLQVASGEMVGLAGLFGSGKSETLEALFGTLPATGQVWCENQEIPRGTPRASLQAGVVFLAGDRKRTVFDQLSVVDNLALSKQTLSHPVRGLGRRDVVKSSARFAKRMNLKAPALDAPLRALSGGNQQKVVLQRCLLCSPKLLLLDEPTRGVDVGAKADILGLLAELCSQGMAIIWTSSELSELLEHSHRTVIMSKGQVVAEHRKDQATEEETLALMMGATS